MEMNHKVSLSGSHEVCTDRCVRMLRVVACHLLRVSGFPWMHSLCLIPDGFFSTASTENKVLLAPEWPDPAQRRAASAKSREGMRYLEVHKTLSKSTLVPYSQGVQNCREVSLNQQTEWELNQLPRFGDL